MAKTDFKTVDEYITTFPSDIQATLQAIRDIIRRAIPDAEEGIGYQIPCYRHNGPVVYFSAFKNHIAFASPPPTIEHFKDSLTAYKTSVSVVQFPYGQPLPEDLITQIAQYHYAENDKKSRKS